MRDLNRRQFLQAAGLMAGGAVLSRLALAQGLSPTTRDQWGRRNVLLIIADDLNTDLGCYGHPIARTPNIDRLAARSVVFDQAYCQFPVCHPSRTSLFSGLRPHRTGVHDLLTPTREVIGDRVLLPQAFKHEGYRSMRVDKAFHVRHDDAESWVVSEETMGRNAEGKPIVPFTQDEPKFLGLEKHLAAAGSPEHDGQTLGNWYSVNLPEDRLMDGRTSRKLVQEIRKSTQLRTPFFAAAGFRRPHVPWIAPKTSFDLFPREQIPVPPRYHTLGPDHLMPEWTWREAAAAYYACINHLDDQVGVLLRAMDNLKLWDSTTIVLIGDNGFSLGERDNRWNKGTLYERSCRVPLIIYDPDAQHGARCQHTVELLDLYPTLASICSVPMPEQDGRSLVPLLRDPDAAWQDYAISTIASEGKLVHSLRDGRYRLICDDALEPSELYDEETDPLESRNLFAADRERAVAMRAQLHSLLG